MSERLPAVERLDPPVMVLRNRMLCVECLHPMSIENDIRCCTYGCTAYDRPAASVITVTLVPK